MDNLSKELVGATTIPLILSILSKQDSYGYDIIQNIKTISNGQLAFKEGTLYPVLHKLDKKGFLKSYWQKTDKGRKRKYYKITKKGLRELQQEKQNWTNIYHIITSLWNSNQPKLA